ncbi:MAG: hypothetical protein RLZZ511_1613 [Cyanobacteriota bacterium]|jgi:hypothetical protein
MDTPIIFIIFNRPDTTSRVFEEIRKVRPRRLLVISDGPRDNCSGDFEKCQSTRQILDKVDWECDVFRNFSDINLGCKKRVSSGLDWAFDIVDEAIILEDDCLPHPDFFAFCELLLCRYREDKRIAAISGQNVQFGRQRTSHSYYFSRYNHCWGWATWKRAWKNFDADMKLWPLLKEGNWLDDILGNKIASRYWFKTFQDTYDGKRNSWAFCWTFSCWIQNQLSILSNVNMVSNIGYGSDGTHTTQSKSKFSEIPALGASFPLNHPPFIVRDCLADRYTQATLYRQPFRERINPLMYF